MLTANSDPLINLPAPKTTEAANSDSYPTTKADVMIGPAFRFASRIARKIAIPKACSLPERNAWSNMTLTVITGSCRVEMEQETHVLKANESLNIPPHHEHRIIADSDLRAIVIFDAAGSC